MSEQARRRRLPEDPMAAHLDRVYIRLDELADRVGRLEQRFYMGVGGLGTVAILNLVANIAQQTGQ